jgi:exopolysaccharide biosynthesis polyprenyl glycosylphosphotransferase
MLRKFSKRRVAGSFIFDWLGSIGLLLAAAWLRINIDHLPQGWIEFFQNLDIRMGWTVAGGYRIDQVLSPLVILLVAVIWPLYFGVFGVYEGKRNSNLQQELLNIFLAVSTSMVFLAGVLYFTYRETPRLILPIFYVLDLLLLWSSRILLHILKKGFGKSDFGNRRHVIIIGAGPVGVNVAAELKKYEWSDIIISGFADDGEKKRGKRISGYPVLGTLSDLAQIKGEYSISDAIITLPLSAHDRLVEVAILLQKLSVRVFVVPDLFTLSFPNASLDGFGGIPLIDLGQPGLHGYRRFLKRAFDTVAVSLGLVVLSPLLLVIAVLIKIDSKGPVFYQQNRIGENGRLFNMLKFRSMCNNADPAIHKAYVTHLIRDNVGLDDCDENGGKSLKMSADPRVTKIGKFLRKSSLDELPQLFNVLKGEMSLVGPRPPLSYEVELYQEWHRKRFEALPGITGMWQVRGRNRVSFDEMVRMDIEYIQKQSFWLDLWILAKTPLAIIYGAGAG